MSTRPLVLAHRGASAYAPENTFAAFDLALEMGAPGLETDVRATADGQLVLLHDERVDRTTNGTGRVAEMALAQVQALDAGSWKGPEFAGERIPTLAAFLGRYGRRALLRLEVKAPGIESALLETGRAAGLLSDVEFSSFAWEAVARLCSLTPGARVGWLVQAVDAQIIARAAAAGVRFLSARAETLGPEALRHGREAGLEVGAWGVQDDGLLARVVALGVDAFTSNWPDRALKLLAAGPAGAAAGTPDQPVPPAET
ncbi:MAG: glycerophosphodiester phosphodiesterase family protein [Candidatus Latescibacterota bacterium]